MKKILVLLDADEQKTLDYFREHFLKEKITIISNKSGEIFTIDEENNMEKII